MRRRVILSLSAYALIFFALACRKHFVMNSNEGDNAAIANFYWQTVHGHFWYSTYFGVNHLGLHASYLSLAIIPLYWLFPYIQTLFAVNSVAIAASGLPFYLIARKVFDAELPAWLMTIAYLSFPAVVTNHVDQIGFEQLSLPFLLGAVWFLMEKRLWPYIVCLVLALLGLENIALTVAGIGVYALVRRYSLKWFGIPLLLSALWLWFTFTVSMPYFAHGISLGAYLGPLGNTPLQALTTCLTHPWLVVATILQPDRLYYLAQLLTPLLIVTPFLAPEIIWALPALGMNLLMAEPSFRVIAWHYNPTVGAMLCLAATFGLIRLARKWRNPDMGRMLTCGVCAASLASWGLWFNPSDYMKPAQHRALRQAAAMIPANASVVAPHTMTAHFANRDTNAVLMFFQPAFKGGGWQAEKLYTMGWVILDANERRYPSDLVNRDLVMSFYTNANYRLTMNEQNVFVFERK